MLRKYEHFINDIRTSVEKIRKYTSGLTFEQFKSKEIVIDAVARNLEIIGEAAANVPDEIKNNYPSVPWRNIKDFRNLLAHAYWKVDLELVWQIVNEKLDELDEIFEH